MATPHVGDKLIKKTTVTQEKLACSVGSGSLKVYATPMVVALMENAATNLAQTYLDEGITTVGTMINIEHISPTPVNAQVYAQAEITKVDGRMFYFNVEAYDDKGLIAKGTHTRVSVKADSFQKKADEKFD